jgi:hypothetical protein
MIIYTVTLSPYVDGIFNNGFSRQFLAKTEGTDYGDGVYCNVRLRDSYVRWSNYRSQGSVILKMDYDENLLNRFLIFDRKLASEIYGDCSIKNQVYSLFGEDADKVYRDFTYIMKAYPDTRQHFDGRTAGLLQVLLRPARRGDLMRALPPEDRGRKVRSEYEHLFKKHNIGGVIYTGGKDGLCLVAYDFSTCRPFEVSYDGGKTWRKKEFKGFQNDVHKKFGTLYKHIDYPIRINIDGDVLEVARVQKDNGKYNYIETQSGEELSPIDFDFATSMNPNNGVFEITYNGEDYKACLDGFFVSDEEFEAWDGHAFEELSMLDGNEEQDEPQTIMYGKYKLPTLAELDDENYLSVYHATQPHAINNLFQFGFDREYLKVMAYGRGIYTTPTPEQSRRLQGSYGPAMLRCKVIGGYDGMLILDRSTAQRVYGNKCHILDQLKTILPEDKAKELYHKCGEYTNSYAREAGEYGIKGVIYPWSGVIAYLFFDISCLIPYSVSYDGGRTFEKKINDKTLERFMTSVDVDYRFGYKYAAIDKAVTIDRKKLYGENVEPTGFARVKKKNGKYNYVEIKSEEEISPIDFEYATSINPQTGLFKITYNGEEYDACIYGFFVNEEELEAFDGHEFHELKLLDENIMAKKNTIRLTESDLKKVINETVKRVLREDYDEEWCYVEDEEFGNMGDDFQNYEVPYKYSMGGVDHRILPEIEGNPWENLDYTTEDGDDITNDRYFMYAQKYPIEAIKKVFGWDEQRKHFPTLNGKQHMVLYAIMNKL